MKAVREDGTGVGARDKGRGPDNGGSGAIER